MQLKKFLDGLIKPCMILIEGARGSGKDVLAHQVTRCLRDSSGSAGQKENKKIYTNVNPRKFDLPKYFRQYKVGSFPSNSIIYLSDAHLQYYATEWGTDKVRTLVRLQNISRHQNIDMVWTTLLATDVPKNYVRRLDASIYKEPVFRSERFERYELRDEVEEAQEFFRGKTKTWKWQHALAFTQKGKFEIHDIRKPFYWTERLSLAHASYQVAPKFKVKIIGV